MPSRFCPRCGTKSASGAKFCADCGASLGGDGATTNGGWRTLAVASSVLVVFLGTGMAIWTTILEPHTLRHGPAAAPASGPAAPADGAQVKTKTEIPAQVKTFIADLAAKAKASPKDVETWMKLGQVDARAAQLDPRYQPEAIAAFEHVLELDPKNVDGLRGLANVYYDRDDHQKAIPIYERYLALRPDDASARTDLGTMYLYGGDPAKAIGTYKDVLKKNPSFLQAHYNLAVTYHGQGNDPAALSELQIARGLAPDDTARKQIDDMIASLKGEPAHAAAAPPAAAPPVDGTRSAFQAAVERAFRSHPIMGSRIVRFEWSGPATGRVVVQNFPMEGMPAAVRDKFTAHLQDELRSARTANPVEGAIRVEIADAGSGDVMATITL